MAIIKLVETCVNDYDDYYKIRSSPSDVFWNGYLSRPDYNEFKKLFLERISSAPFCKPEDRHIYLVQIFEDSRIKNIGFIQLIWRKDNIEIGYTIIEQYQGNGYATQALQLAIPLAQNYMKKVTVQIRDDNIASQRVANKCGFVKTNIYIEKIYPNTGKVKLRTYYLN